MPTLNVPVVPRATLLDRAFAAPLRGGAAALGVPLVILYMAVLFPAASVKSGSGENQIRDLQKARTVDQFTGVLKKWSSAHPDAIGIMKWENLIRLDSSFPAVYGLTFASLYAVASGRRRPTRLDRWLFALPLAAAVCDYAENGLELYALAGIETATDLGHAIKAGSLSAPAVAGQWAFAQAKFGLL